MVKIREVPAPEGMKDIFPVAQSAWGMEKPESFIADMLNALQYHGGLVLGAYEGEKMVGFQYAFIAKKAGIFYLYSHMTGVLEEKKYTGIGYELKKAQRRWAIDNGFKLVSWTFDPLMALNAGFNVRKLGVIVRAYLPDFYGIMTDRLNMGVKTDRFVAEWWVDAERKAEEFDPSTVPAVNATEETEDGIRKITGVSGAEGRVVAVEIPHSFLEVKKLDPEAAADWRLRTREIFTGLFARGYTVVSFGVHNRRCYYLLRSGYGHPAIPAAGPFQKSGSGIASRP